jgi:hypothetical protein
VFLISEDARNSRLALLRRPRSAPRDETDTIDDGAGATHSRIWVRYYPIPRRACSFLWGQVPCTHDLSDFT